MSFANNVVLEDSILKKSFNNVRNNFYNKIDPSTHAAVYKGRFDLAYAEPEFTGKYLDICAHFFELDKDDRAKNNGKIVVDSIFENQRDDGYLGCLEDGNELQAFSVWNHGFTLYGLIRFYEATGDDNARHCAVKAADWLIATFMCENAPDILNATNDGSQHLSSIFPMMQMYRVFKEKKYLDYVDKILKYCETTNMNLLSFDSILQLRSRKGIEMFVIYLGILQYGIEADCKKAIDATERYWQEVYTTQIRNTGNGTIYEKWTPDGNAPILLPTDSKPNETCVAVGWVEMSLKLFSITGEAKYLDAIEQTLYNHMIGSLESRGEDFAYYQGNYGKKIYRTAGGMYQCCRYRGFTLFTYLKDYLYSYDGQSIIPMVYTASKFEIDGLSVAQSTSYPADFKVSFDIENRKANQKIKLRLPRWCSDFNLIVNGKEEQCNVVDGYITVNLSEGITTIIVDFNTEIKHQIDKIDEKDYISFNYGPLLLAMDTHFSNRLWEKIKLPLSVSKETSQEEIVHFKCNQMHLIDFASAGGLNPNEDEYTVYIPVE